MLSALLSLLGGGHDDRFVPCGKPTLSEGTRMTPEEEREYWRSVLVPLLRPRST